MYLGAMNAPIMKLKLKGKDGSQKTLEIRALTGNDTLDGDGAARVKYHLQQNGLPVAKAGQILKLLNKYSSSKAGYQKKMGPGQHEKGGDETSGKYSKRRRSNVAVIIVRIVFIGSFLFYCLLLNHSFQTNPNKITNCLKLFSIITTYNYIAPASLF